MGAGIPYSVPSHTVTQACISANQAITSGSKILFFLFYSFLFYLLYVFFSRFSPILIHNMHNMI